jgi:hypothetical protein
LRNAAHYRLLHILRDLALARLGDHLSSTLFGLLNARTRLERFQRGLNLVAQFTHPTGEITLELFRTLALKRGSEGGLKLLTHLAKLSGQLARTAARLLSSRLFPFWLIGRWPSVIAHPGCSFLSTVQSAGS